MLAGPELAIQFTFGDAKLVLEAGAGDLPVRRLASTSTRPTRATFQTASAEELSRASSTRVRPRSRTRKIAGFVAQLPVDDVALVPNGDLRFVPEQIARQISELQGAKTAQAKEAVA